MTTSSSSHVYVPSTSRVLVADPDPDVRVSYAASFTARHWDVVHASDGRDALVKALTHTPSLVVTELRLPFIDGVKLCEILRSDHATLRVPIVVVTSETREAAMARALEAGADVVLQKPTRVETLTVEFERLMSRTLEVKERAGVLPAKAGERADAARRHVMLSRAHERMTTTTPPCTPPKLTCPKCDTALIYDHSFVGGVSERHQEQWDYYACSSCGTFQYRQRTRKLRHVE
jgi:CheY-like chemotaxis protein